MYINTKLTKSGNSWGIRLPKEVIAISGLKPGQSLALEVRPRRLILRPQQQVADHKLDQAYKDSRAAWQQAFQDAWDELYGPDYD